MSTHLYWRPVVNDAKSLPNALKSVLAAAWSLGSSPRTVTEHDVAFLHGIAAAGSDEAKAGAQELIDLVEKHGAVEVWLES